MLIFKPSQFVKFLSPRLARFTLGDTDWVFRSPVTAPQKLGLASEYMGYWVATRLAVPVPAFDLARMSEPLPQIPLGVGTATQWIDDHARWPDLEKDPPESFWVKDTYLEKAAAVRVADTWMMNYDRRKKGNVAICDGHAGPEVYFLDFEQAFLSPSEGGGPRHHWVNPEFSDAMLQVRERLSGFLGESTAEHFRPSLQRLDSVTRMDIGEALRSMPPEWGISRSDQLLWTERLWTRGRIVTEIFPA